MEDWNIAKMFAEKIETVDSCVYNAIMAFFHGSRNFDTEIANIDVLCNLLKEMSKFYGKDRQIILVGAVRNNAFRRYTFDLPMEMSEWDQEVYGLSVASTSVYPDDSIAETASMSSATPSAMPAIAFAPAPSATPISLVMPAPLIPAKISPVFTEPEKEIKTTITINTTTCETSSETSPKVVSITTDAEDLKKPNKTMENPEVFEKIYVDEIEKVCKKYKKDFAIAKEIILKSNRPYTTICKNKTKCDRKDTCWFAHTEAEQSAANHAHIHTLRKFNINDKEITEFINEMVRIFGEDWQEYGNIIYSHKNGYIPYATCNYGVNCRNMKNCKFAHEEDEATNLFKKHKETFKRMQFVKE